MLTADRSSSPFFEMLSLEIRLRVYGCLLFVGKVTPYTKGQIKQSLPYVPLLRTCKAVKFEAEPVVYKNTFIFPKFGAIEKLFHDTLSTPARKLLLKSLEVSLGGNNFAVAGPLLSQSGQQLQCRMIFQLRLVAWQHSVAPILEDLTLDQLVLDLSDSSYRDGCKCRMAAAAIMCFEQGFALQTPKAVQVRGWDGGRADVETMVRDCLEAWTMRRGGHVAGYTDLAFSKYFEAEEWLLEAARKEERDSNRC